MSASIVQAAQAPFQHSFGLLSTFIDICPDTIWEEKNGGWPVWQQVAHALSAISFFASGADDAPIVPPCPVDVVQLKEQGTEPVSKAAMRAYAAQCKARAESYFARLQDAELVTENAPLSARIGFSLTHAATLGMMASHTLYHLGSCDAAMRDHGLSGAF